MKCTLCEEGVSLRELAAPKLKVAEKRKAAQAEHQAAVDAKAQKRAKHSGKEPSKRLFVGALPLVIDVSTINETFGGSVKLVHWITDHTTGLFYGSAFVQMASLSEAKRIVEMAHADGGIKIGKRKLRINFAPPSETDVWPPLDHVPRERPPVP